MLYGAPTVTPRGELWLENPETEFFEEGEEADPVHSGRIVGVYHRVAGTGSRLWRTLVRRALDLVRPDLRAAAVPPAELLGALEAVHFPADLDAADRARGRLAEEELFVLAARIEDKRARLRERGGVVLEADEAMRASARAALPFRLTGAQRRAVREIAEDLASGRAMARLLQGDVGSGKTVVAGLALLLAARNGVQGALMAPTEILAEQLAASLAAWMEKAGVRMGLLTGRVRGRARAALLSALAAGDVDVLVGTHALIEAPVQFRRLGLVVVDEQQRFGVAHRAKLFRKGSAPHVLVMTATPIPRSLAWAIYGELDVSVLDEKPPGRASVVTRVRGPDGRAAIDRFAAQRVAAGERVFIVVPAIEQGAREIAATRATAQRIAAAGPGLRVGVVHGRMPPDERAGVMADFAAGRVSDSRRDDGRRGRRGRAGGHVHGRRERRGLRSGAAPPAARARRPQLPAVLVRPRRRRKGEPGSASAAGGPEPARRTASRSPKRISRPEGRATCSGFASRDCQPCGWPIPSRT